MYSSIRLADFASRSHSRSVPKGPDLIMYRKDIPVLFVDERVQGARKIFRERLAIVLHSRFLTAFRLIKHGMIVAPCQQRFQPDPATMEGARRRAGSFRFTAETRDLLL